jgi:hypothetical protein
VGGTGTSLIDGTVNMSGTPTVNVVSGATLRFSGSSLNTNAVTFSGDGVIQPDSTTTTFGTNTVNMPAGRFDLDGSTFGDRLLLSGVLTLNVAGVDSGGNTFNSDEIEIGALGNLTVNHTNAADSWVMAGVLDLNGQGGGGVSDHLGGSDVELGGTTTVVGSSRTNARVDITGIVDITTGTSEFFLSGGNTSTNPNRIEGGTVNGPGELAADTGSALHGFGTINANVDFDGTSHLLADDGTLNVAGAVLDVSTLGTNDNDGILNMVNAWNTNIPTLVNLEGGELSGGLITNDGASGINGDGLVSARVLNNTLIDAENAGTLIIQTAANNNDWDGTTNTGLLRAGSGNLEVRDNAVFPFNGTVQANTLRQVFANGFELEFEPASTLVLNGGTYRSTNATDIGGTVTVGAGTSTLNISGTTIFENGSSTALTGNLQLDNAATRINAGATFSGGGSLINMPGRTLTLLDGADVDVLLENRGTLVLGASPGQTQGLDFQQTDAGAWNVELGGTGINDYDRMTLTGLASLDGTLNLSLIGPYVPALADPLLTILTASSVSNTFDAVVQPAGMPAGLRFKAIYNAGNVQLDVVPLLIGDYNDNGTVDAADYIVWREAEADGATFLENRDPGNVGAVGPADFNSWRARFGNVAGSGAGAILDVAVPEPSTIMMLIVGTLAMCFRRRLTPVLQIESSGTAE